MAGLEQTINTISVYIILFSFVIVIFAAAIAFIFRVGKEIVRRIFLRRHTANPVISPTVGSEWDEVGTFNPAAWQDEAGNVHLLYRAVGADGVSRFGYAASKDGNNFDERSPYPVFAMYNPRGSRAPLEKKPDPVMYPSGGSWGGSEDPRMVNIDGKIYVTFSAFDGWDFIRMAVISISEKDFLKKNWKWSKPVLISSPNTISKNWVLFPEKINGKFAIVHSVVPQVSIAYVDNINATMKPIHSPRPFGPQKGREDSWDNSIRGAGPPPIKTDKGWLLFYHAVTHGDHRYKLGCFLLDLENPEKVIARSPSPVLFSDAWYENDWKSGVVYASGAVVRGDTLHVYYGGGDKHICVAHTPLSELLNWLLEDGRV